MEIQILYVCDIRCTYIRIEMWIHYTLYIEIWLFE